MDPRHLNEFRLLNQTIWQNGQEVVIQRRFRHNLVPFVKLSVVVEVSSETLDFPFVQLLKLFRANRGCFFENRDQSLHLQVVVVIVIVARRRNVTCQNFRGINNR